MKTKIIAVTIFCFAAAANVHGFGLGAQLNFSAGNIFAPGAALVISPADQIHLAFNWYLDFKNVNTIGMTLDAQPLTLPLANFKAGSINFTLGVGIFANVMFLEKPDVTGGLRVPFGLSLFLGKNVFEIYTHIAPSFGASLLPSLGLSNPFFPLALGARFWIR
ncbi:MAG: hypothetical protein FWD78_14125 [Treponema sp.]|nr:hypothetical protein [Treponema sp.]